MHYPEHLKKAVLAKAKDLPLEGFVEGARPATAKSDADWGSTWKRRN